MRKILNIFDEALFLREVKNFADFFNNFATTIGSLL